MLTSLKVAVDQEIVTGERFFYTMRSKPTAFTCSIAEARSREVRIMTTRFVASIAAAILAVLIATSGFACTTVCLREQGRALVAYDYDFHPAEGLVLLNKHGTSKPT